MAIAFIHDINPHIHTLPASYVSSLQSGASCHILNHTYMSSTCCVSLSHSSEQPLLFSFGGVSRLISAGSEAAGWRARELSETWLQGQVPPSRR